MPTCVIDGREISFSSGENMIEVARRAGIEIPYFCYHPGLSVVGHCRMCIVEVEKVAKLQTACSTALLDGMVISTQTPRVIHQQKAVMEFLLINHPLDCPICDKSGECDLQEISFKFGEEYCRYQEERRTFVDLDMGPVIVKNMNRCIHCSRCIRFGQEVAGIREMVAFQRGNSTEITTLNGQPLATEYAGNYADICPTGSLLLKDFRFKKRVWFLKKTKTVCEACSRGCNMEIHEENNVIYRCVPRENPEVNRHWLCDEGRFNFHHVHDQDRILEPSIMTDSGPQTAEWATAVAKAKEAIGVKNVLFLVGSDLTLEEAKMIQGFVATEFPGGEIFHFGTPGVRSAAEDDAADRILKRKSKTSNLHGMERLGLRGFEGLPKEAQAVIVISGGRAVLPNLGSAPAVAIGVFRKEQAKGFRVVLPGLTFAEKDGTVVNYQGREQAFKRAIDPRGKSKELGEVFAAWTK